MFQKTCSSPNFQEKYIYRKLQIKGFEDQTQSKTPEKSQEQFKAVEFKAPKFMNIS